MVLVAASQGFGRFLTSGAWDLNSTLTVAWLPHVAVYDRTKGSLVWQKRPYVRNYPFKWGKKPFSDRKSGTQCSRLPL